VGEAASLLDVLHLRPHRTSGPEWIQTQTMGQVGMTYLCAKAGDSQDGAESGRRGLSSRLRSLAGVVQRIRPRTGGFRVGLPIGAALGVVTPPVDLRLLGRTLLHAALVGVGAGLVGAAFFAGLEYTQDLLLGHLGGYAPLRSASGTRTSREGSI